jgi:hypothetical protein
LKADYFMKKTYFVRTLILLLYAWPGAGVAQAASSGSVLAWGYNDYGQTNVPLAAQSGVTAIAANAVQSHNF